MINTAQSKHGTEVVLLVSEDETNDGIFQWEAGRGYLIANFTDATPREAVERAIEACRQHEAVLLKMERDLWNTPRSPARARPSNILERFKTQMFRAVGVVDS